MWKWLHKKRKSTNKRTIANQRCCMESLEPRLLLNGDPLVESLSFNVTEADEGDTVQLEVSFTDEASPDGWTEEPMAITGLSDPSVHEFSPFITPEGMYFSRYKNTSPTTGHFEIWYAANDSTTPGPFGDPELVNIGSNVTTPWVNAGHNRIYYYYGEGSTQKIEVGVKDASGIWRNFHHSTEASDATQRLGNINALGVDYGSTDRAIAHPSLTPDELTIVFAGNNLDIGDGQGQRDDWNLYMATRGSVEDATGDTDVFGNIQALDGINNVVSGNKMYPKITPDGLNIYFALDNQKIMVSTWDAQNNMFGTPTHVIGQSGDVAIMPSLSTDGMTLYMAKADVVDPNDGSVDDWGIYQSTRIPSIETHSATIDWGDGSTPQLISNVNNVFTENHTYQDDASEIAVTINDSSGNSGSDSAAFTVNNVAPTVAITGAPAAAAEGDAISLGSTIVDPGTLDTHTITWSVTKDSTVYQTGTPDDEQTFNFTPTDNGAYEVMLIVEDDDGGIETDTVTINVINVAPAATITGAPATSTEGDTIFLGSSPIVDPGTPDTHSYAWSVTKDGTAYQTGTSVDQQTFDFTPADNGVYEVTLTVVDNDGGVGTDAVTITVLNVAPAVTITGAPATADEGDAISLGSGPIVDPGILDTHTVTWSVTKDSTAYQTGTPIDEQTFNFTPTDNGVYEVKLTVIDNDGDVGTDSATITVNNVDPVVLGENITHNATWDDEIAVGDAVTIIGSFSDAGSADTHTVSIDWGKDNGDTTSATVNQAARTFTSGAYTGYTEGGLYEVTITVTDDDTGEATVITKTVIIGVGIQGTTLNIVGSNASEMITVSPDTVNPSKLVVNVREKGTTTVQTYTVDAGVDSIDVYARGGSDMIAVSHALSYGTNLDGGEDADLIFGGQGSDNILGGGGDDILFGLNGDDIIDGGLGDDQIWGNFGDDILSGGDGYDIIFGGLGDDTIADDPDDTVFDGWSWLWC